MCCFRGLKSYGGMKAMPRRHANCGSALLQHSGGKIWVYFMMINFILPIIGSHKIFLTLTLTGKNKASSHAKCANKATVVLIINSILL